MTMGPILEEAEQRRQAELLEARVREESRKRREQSRERLSRGLRGSVGFLLSAGLLAALLYYHNSVASLASVVKGDVSSKVKNIGNSSGIHKTIQNREQEVDEVTD